MQVVITSSKKITNLFEDYLHSFVGGIVKTIFSKILEHFQNNFNTVCMLAGIHCCLVVGLFQLLFNFPKAYFCLHVSLSTFWKGFIFQDLCVLYIVNVIISYNGT